VALPKPEAVILHQRPGQAQRFLAAHDQINNLFHLCRDHLPADQYRAARAQAFQTWAVVTGVAALA
jgi:putative transposase